MKITMLLLTKRFEEDMFLSETRAAHSCQAINMPTTSFICPFLRKAPAHILKTKKLAESAFQSQKVRKSQH